jgi:hypothetical protein
MEFFLETMYEIFAVGDSDFGSDERQVILKPIYQSFDTMGKANVWIIENGLPDVNYTILEILRKKRN